MLLNFSIFSSVLKILGCCRGVSNTYGAISEVCIMKGSMRAPSSSLVSGPARMRSTASSVRQHYLGRLNPFTNERRVRGSYSSICKTLSAQPERWMTCCLVTLPKPGMLLRTQADRTCTAS